jgi:hypothetical protein
VEQHRLVERSGVLGEAASEMRDEAHNVTP